MMANPWDPYRLADVYMPWDRDDDLVWLDDDEWGGDESDREVLKKGMTVQARSRLRQYLSMNGAAVWTRIDRALVDANLQGLSHPAGSLVAAVSAAELLVRFFMVRPMIAGLVFNTKLAMRLVREGPSAQVSRDRKVLPDVCRAWGIDLDSLTLPNTQPLWTTLLDLVEVRNRYVHRADPVMTEQAQGAVDCVDGLLDQIVKPLTHRVGLGWPPDNWTHKGRTHDPVESTFEYMGS